VERNERIYPPTHDSELPAPTVAQPWLSAKSLAHGAIGTVGVFGVISLQQLVAGQGPWFPRFLITEPVGWAILLSTVGLNIVLDRWVDRNLAARDGGTAEDRAHYWNTHIDRLEKPGWWWRSWRIVLPGVMFGVGLGALVVWTSETATLRQMLTWATGVGLFAGAVAFAFVAVWRKAALRRFKTE
jgi:hypothetical protein